MSQPKTLFEKVWEQHLVAEPKGEPTLLYIDLQLVHEVTSPQAFEGLRLAGRKVGRPDRTIATVDHNVPTTIKGRLHILDQIAATQIATLRQNCAEFRRGTLRRELARARHRSRDRARAWHHQAGHDDRLRRLAHIHPRRVRRIGLRHRHQRSRTVLATQTLPQSKPKTFRISVEGALPQGVTAKDIILAIIGQIGTDGATGCVVEYAGSAIRALSMEGRMTDLQHEHRGRRARGHDRAGRDDVCVSRGDGGSAPQGAAWDRAVEEWRKLPTDPGAKFDRELTIDAATLVPYVSWGTSPGHGCADHGEGARPGRGAERAGAQRLGARARVHGAEAGNAARRDCD